MRIKILGKVWNLRFVPNLANRGDCDAPTVKGREIRIWTGNRGEMRLNTLIHEMLHAAGWPLDEEFVDQFANDSARALWKLGYRDINEAN